MVERGSTARIRNHRKLRPDLYDLVPALRESGAQALFHSAGPKKDPRRSGGGTEPRG